MANVPDFQIDAGAQALRDRMQGTGKKLTPWNKTPNSRKRKWRDYAACVLTAAASAKQIKDSYRDYVESVATEPGAES